MLAETASPSLSWVNRFEYHFVDQPGIGHAPQEADEKEETTIITSGASTKVNTQPSQITAPTPTPLTVVAPVTPSWDPNCSFRCAMLNNASTINARNSMTKLVTEAMGN